MTGQAWDAHTPTLGCRTPGCRTAARLGSPGQRCDVHEGTVQHIQVAPVPAPADEERLRDAVMRTERLVLKSMGTKDGA